MVRADQARALGLSGAGVRVGVLSDGIAGIATSCAAGELPASTCSAIGAHSFSARPDGDINAGAEGTAMLEIIADLAPGAELFFANFSTPPERANAVDWLTDTARVMVIADDIGEFVPPYDGSGPVSQVAAEAANKGVLYAVAAGNEALGHYSGSFVPEDGSAYSFHLFAPGVDMLPVSVAVGDRLWAQLTWNDPFFSSANDYDLIIYDASGTPVASSTDVQDGSGVPMETVDYTNGTGSGTLWLALAGANYPAVRNLCVFVLDPAQFLSGDVPSSSVVPPGEGPEVLTCGAVDASTPGTVEAYSSEGPTNDGRLKPEIAGPDDVTTSVPGFAPFQGTSAAAPHIAGVAALLREAYPSATMAELTETLMESTWDIGPLGLDYSSGAGLADARAALDALAEPRPPEVSPSGHPPFLLQKSGGAIQAAWEDLGSQVDAYNLYEGSLPKPFQATPLVPLANAVYDHGRAGLCGTSGTVQGAFQVVSFTPSAGSHYYLISATLADREGPTGFTSHGLEIDAAQSTCPP